MPGTNLDELWTKEKEDVLKSYAEESECMYVTYTKEYLRYKKYGHFFTIPSIIISTVTGLLAFDANFSGSANGPTVIGSLNILVAIIGTIYKVLKYSELEAQFAFLAGEHLKLHSEIQSTLLKSPEERDNALEFMRKIENRRMQLIDDAPVVSDATKNKFKRKYKNTHFEMPLLLNKLSHVKIYGREVESEVHSLKSESTDKLSLATPKKSIFNRFFTQVKQKAEKNIDKMQTTITDKLDKITEETVIDVEKALEKRESEVKTNIEKLERTDIEKDLEIEITSGEIDKKEVQVSEI